MTKLELLNVFLNDRLTAAAEEIFRAVKDTVAEYQSEALRSKEENERLKRLLNVAVQRLLLQPGETGQCLLSIHKSTRIYPKVSCQDATNYIMLLCTKEQGIVHKILQITSGLICAVIGI